jgi:hypothetical protein
MAGTVLPSRREAIRTLEQGRAQIAELLDRLPRSAMTTTGIGGGTWSPKDLIGHLASWEEYALDALAAWERGERAPIDELQHALSTSRINEQAVARKAGWSLARVRREADRTHEDLLAAIRGMSDARWRSPATSRGRKPLGARLGSLLVGVGPFGHDAAHVRSLAAFVGRRSSA